MQSNRNAILRGPIIELLSLLIHRNVVALDDVKVASNLIRSHVLHEGREDRAEA